MAKKKKPAPPPPEEEEILEEETTFEESTPPPARPRLFTIFLFVLNLIAGAAFVYLVLMLQERKQAFAYAVFQHDLALWGLPLRSEEDGLSASRATLPKQFLSKEQIQAAFAARPGTKNFSEAFLAVEEQFAVRTKPSYITKEVLEDLFTKDISLNPVKSLEEEIDRVKKRLFENDDLGKAAQDASIGAGDENQMRDKVKKALLPLATNTVQVRALNKTIQDTPASGLSKLLEQAYLRRMLIDILGPLEHSRPGDTNNYLTEKFGDLEGLKNEELKEQLRLRLDQAVAKDFNPAVHQGKEWAGVERGTIEKRQAAAYLLFAISQVRRPDNTPLYLKSAERAQAILGLWDFSFAIQAYIRALQDWEARIVHLIQTDRQGNEVLWKGELARTPAFVDQYPNMVDKLRLLARDIEFAKERVDYLTVEKTKEIKHLDDRKKQLEKVTTELVEERDKTARLMSKLNENQDSYFNALRILSTAQDENVRLLEQIQKLNRNRAGGKQP